MKTNFFLSTFLLTALVVVSSCNTNNKGDIVSDNFDFAAQQLQYAVNLTAEAINSDTRDSVAKARRPLVSPRTTNDDGSLRMVSAGDWTSGFFFGRTVVYV
jgi:hypothetical protein